ncbi:MAG: hypothetical protein Q7S21_02835 [archaeon]|nr:hypothetical protein [archaeon]
MLLSLILSFFNIVKVSLLEIRWKLLLLQAFVGLYLIVFSLGISALFYVLFKPTEFPISILEKVYVPFFAMWFFLAVFVGLRDYNVNFLKTKTAPPISSSIIAIFGFGFFASLIYFLINSFQVGFFESIKYVLINPLAWFLFGYLLFMWIYGPTKFIRTYEFEYGPAVVVGPPDKKL